MISISQIERAIQLNLHDWQFSVDQIAECLNIICPSHLREIVHKRYHLSPHNLIKKRRMERAVRLLVTEKCIKKVSHAVGYINPRSFRNPQRVCSGFGITPTEYVHTHIPDRLRNAANAGR